MFAIFPSIHLTRVLLDYVQTLPLPALDLLAAGMA